MPALTVKPKNEVRLRRTAFGWEGTPGTAAALIAQLYWKLNLTDAAPLQGEEEDTGTWDPYTEREQGIVAITGTLAGPIAHEDIPILLRAAVSGETAGTSDGGTPPLYAFTGIPSATEDNLWPITAGQDAPDNPYLGVQIYITQFTISADTDGQASTWMLSANVIARSLTPLSRLVGQLTGATGTTATVSGASWTANQWAGGLLQITGGTGQGQERRILSNTPTVLTVDEAFVTQPDNTSMFRIIPAAKIVPDRDREMIRGQGTKVWIDDITSPLKTTQMTGRVISFSVTVDLQRYFKTFLEDEYQSSERTGRNSRMITFQIRLENDRERWNEARTERENQRLGTLRRIAIGKVGKRPVRAGVFQEVGILLPRCKYTGWSQSDRQANMAITLSGECYPDPVLGYPFALPAKTRVAMVG